MGNEGEGEGDFVSQPLHDNGQNAHNNESKKTHITHKDIWVWFLFGLGSVDRKMMGRGGGGDV